MSKPNKLLSYEYAQSVIKPTQKQKEEKNDCSVRAIATAVGIGYDSAHKFVKEVFKRVKRKGCTNMVKTCIQLQDEEQELEGKKFRFKYIPRQHIRNEYKLYGEYIYRNKTVKSFVQSFPKGTFLVFVAKHVFTIKDGLMIDNTGEEFRPTRKVIDAVEVILESNQPELDLFPEMNLNPITIKAARRGR